MIAALEALAAMEADRRIAILGLMGELDDDVEGHREVARIAETLGVQVVATGTDFYGVRPTDDPVALIGKFQAGDVVGWSRPAGPLASSASSFNCSAEPARVTLGTGPAVAR